MLIITGREILCMAAKQGQNFLFYLPNTTKCIQLVSVMLLGLADARTRPG
jgi:hypothetical protein